MKNVFTFLIDNNTKKILVITVLFISTIIIYLSYDTTNQNEQRIYENARKLLNEVNLLSNHQVSGFRGHKSYKCSKQEMMTQMERIDFFDHTICDTETPWELFQLLYPDANVFIDVGGNVGYTAAKIFGLWSPGHQLNRKKLRDATKQDFDASLFKNKDNLNTFCGDGNGDDTPLLCRGRTNAKECNYKRSIQVYSFDGQKMHIAQTTGVIYRHFPELHPNSTISSLSVKASWEYIFSAVTTNTGNETMGYFEVVTHEGGHLRHGQNHLTTDTAAVPITSIDQFCSSRNINHVDIIKIDAESSDIEVIKGSFETLKERKVKMITYEVFIITFYK